MKLLDWLDSRSGYRAFMHHALYEPVRGGARWAYVFGSGLAFLFIMQAATGILLALFFSASTQEAWGSVWYITNQVTLGWFVRGLHHWTSSVMVVLLVVHMLQVFAYGAYRAPKELAWWTGIGLLAVALAFSLTGYLLPWDQKGYWATRVVTSIAGTFPLFGGMLKSTLQGGNDFGNLTLTRFFGFHVFFLPAALTISLAVHIYLFRRNGVTPKWSRSAEELDRTTEPFWPRQLTFDAVFSAFLLAIIVGLTLKNHGAPLEAPADPSSNYLPRPEWYFLWLFEMLKFLPGQFEGIGLMVFSALAGLFLAALPLVDRSKEASPRYRIVHFGIAGVLAAIIGGLTTVSMWRDAHDPAVASRNALAEAEAKTAYRLAELGLPPGGAQDLYLNDPRESGRKLFADKCESCHAIDGKGGDSAPDLTGYLSHEWVAGLIKDATAPKYYGRTKVNGMDPADATPEQISSLADFVLSQGGRAAAPKDGATLFDEQGCAGCHSLTPGEKGDGPNLAHYGSREWILGAIRNPRADVYYGADAEMTPFEGKLTDGELDDLLTWLGAPARLEAAVPSQAPTL